jgi:hypothetical protein
VLVVYYSDKMSYQSVPADDDENGQEKTHTSLWCCLVAFIYFGVNTCHFGRDLPSALVVSAVTSMIVFNNESYI